MILEVRKMAGADNLFFKKPKEVEQLSFAEKPKEDWYVTWDQKKILSTLNACTTAYIVDPKDKKSPVLVIEGDHKVYLIRNKEVEKNE